MASLKTIILVDKLVWYLIYGGLLMVLLGLILGSAGAGPNWLLMVGGFFMVFAGAVLLYVRSRLKEDS